MNICILGAGAIGGFIGAKLAASPAAQADELTLTALARGATLSALNTHGWRLRSGDTVLQRPAHATDNPAALGEQDLVIIAVKGQSLAAAVQGIAPLLGESTMVMPAMNGVPWWFCQGLPEFTARLTSLDPTAAIAQAIDPKRVLGCVMHASTACPEPGLVQHKFGDTFMIGEPDGSLSARSKKVADMLAQAGFKTVHSAQIRYEIWYKLWGNMTMNPISAITGATGDKILAGPLVKAFCSAVMVEAAAVGARIGCPIPHQPEDRHAITATLGAFKTSMLQDVEAHRPIELDAIVGAAYEIAQRLNIPTPNMAALLGLTRLFAQQKQLY